MTPALNNTVISTTSRPIQYHTRRHRHCERSANEPTQINRHTNPTAHDDCGYKAHGVTAHVAG